MPRKKKNPQSNTSDKIPYTQIKFVFNNLEQTELDLFDDSEHSKLSSDDIDSGVTRLIESGFRLSVRWDDYSECIQITATCDIKGKPSSGYATSARSDSYIDAIMILLYKIQVIADNDLSSYDNDFRTVRG